MSTTPTRARRAAVGLVPAAALAACALLPSTPAQAAPAPNTGGEPATSAAEHGSDLSRYVPDGKLELTAKQRDRLDARAAKTLRNSRAGGVRVAPDTIVWKEQGAILNLAVDGKARDYESTALDGRVRVWEHAGFGGDRLTFVKCKFQKFRWYNFTNKVSSWRNTQYGGAVSRLHYWDGSSVKFLDSLYPGQSNSWHWSNSRYNDRADFLRVCD